MLSRSPLFENAKPQILIYVFFCSFPGQRARRLIIGFLLLCTYHFDYALIGLLNMLYIDAPGVRLQQFRVGLLDLGEELLDSREHYYGNV